MTTHTKIKAVSVALTLLLATSAWGGSSSIRSTKHNLSISGTGEITASSESRICIFCHIPHRDGGDEAYLWNRSTPTTPYIPYDSTTIRAVVGQPTGSSRMCLSCHDGTIALGAVTSSPDEILMRGGLRYMPDGTASNLGTDLSDDHPISFTYDTTLSTEDLGLRDPGLLPPAISLEHGDQLQCTSCHDPHDDTFGRFLVMDNVASSLCTACHDKRGWVTSSHSRSTATLARSGGLWANTDYRTVAENGCENCHVPHSAGSGQRLLIFADEKDTCMVCHDGRVASSDIAAAFSKPYRHPVGNYPGLHDAAEDFTSGTVPEHVTCSDCHDPHQASETPASDAAMVSGATRGASGVSIGGAALPEARYVYEICFKCHADQNVVDDPPVARQIEALNKREQFDPAAPSYHPVAAAGKNQHVPSLLAPYTTGSRIGCTDCHGNDDPAGAAGPHGSDYPNLLVRRYETEDNTPESPSAYALCYKCHSRSVLMNSQSFPHKLHVVDENAPCSACHDPHGVSAGQGDSIHNSHLINFDLSIVSPNPVGRLEYVSRGRYSGQCFLSCHGMIHNPLSYPQ